MIHSLYYDVRIPISLFVQSPETGVARRGREKAVEDGNGKENGRGDGTS